VPISSITVLWGDVLRPDNKPTCLSCYALVPLTSNRRHSFYFHIVSSVQEVENYVYQISLVSLHHQSLFHFLKIWLGFKFLSPLISNFLLGFANGGTRGVIAGRRRGKGLPPHMLTVPVTKAKLLNH
jgi:hypothetical protein